MKAQFIVGSVILALGYSMPTAFAAKGVVQANNNCKAVVTFEDTMVNGVGLTPECRKSLLGKVADRSDLNFKIALEADTSAEFQIKISVEGGKSYGEDTLAVSLFQDGKRVSAKPRNLQEASRLSADVNCDRVGVLLSDLPACSLR